MNCPAGTPRLPLITRFAPSPNGPLHLGHAYAAIVAHDRAASGGGECLLRIEDIDGTRSRPELAQDFRADLVWLGLSFREVAAQATRIPAYRAALDRLSDEGLLYPCHCTRAEIAAAAQHFGPDGPVYPGTCRHRGDRGRSGDAPSWRLDVAAALQRTGPLRWFDEYRGWQEATPGAGGDVVLWRKDAPASYHLAVTLDDHADAVSVVTRGADLFAATHVHRLLQALLGLSVPVWHHHRVLVEGDGRKLAKRRGAPALSDWRRAGADGIALARALREGGALPAPFPAGLSLSEYVNMAP